MDYVYWIAFVLILAICIPIIQRKKKEEQKAFEKTTITFAIIQHMYTRKSETLVTYSFHKKKRKSITMESEPPDGWCISYREPGDTIVVEYSLTDNRYCRILHCYWNERIKREYGLYPEFK